ncbi:MAG: tetratricopeptide repeat protein [Chitinophagaceae bacterium]|nr:tetratricopeptide repeat protein [Chitinophagaceae bacterium]
MKHVPGLSFLAIFLFACNAANNEPPADKNIDTREKILQDEIRNYPDSLLLKENLAQYYRDNGSYDKSIGIITEALRKDSNNARLWDIKAILHFENGDTAQAIGAYEKAVASYPEPQYMMSLGSLYAQTRDPKALRIADLLLANKNARADKEAVFIKGLYYNYNGEKQKAIGYFDQCLNMDYNYMLAYREKSIALYDMGKYEDALGVLEKATTLQSSYDEGYYWMGRCLEKLDRKAEAIDNYRTALQLDPTFIDAQEALARLGVK